MTLYLPTMDHDLISVGPSTVATVARGAQGAVDGQPSLCTHSGAKR